MTPNEAEDRLDVCKDNTFLVRFSSDGETYSVSTKISDSKGIAKIEHSRLNPKDIPNIFSLVSTWKKKQKFKAPPALSERPYEPIFNTNDYIPGCYDGFTAGVGELIRKDKEFFNLGRELNFELSPNEDVEFVG